MNLEEELRKLHPAAFQWALHCTDGKAQDAEDVLQAAYEALLNGSADFEERSSFKSFLFGVIRNKARSLSRRTVLRRLTSLDGALRQQVEHAGPDRVEAAQRRAIVRAAVEKLSAKQRDVLELVFYHDLTIAEAADAMGVRLGTARTHYARAKEALRAQLSDGEVQWMGTTTGN